MNLKEIKEIIHLMNEHDLAEIEIEREGAKIKIRKSHLEAAAEKMRQSHAEYHIERKAPTVSQESQYGSPQSEKPLKEIISPMVGTFYRAPSPEAPSFVEAGQIVEIGQVVCIIEAMKLMNEIKSEIRGKIVEVAVENAQPVEFGQTLFIVEPF